MLGALFLRNPRLLVLTVALIVVDLVIAGSNDATVALGPGGVTLSARF